MDPLNVKQALRALVANTPREPAPVMEPERDPVKRLSNKIQTDIVKEAPPGLLERAGSTAASGLSAVGNLLDVPGSMARDVLTWLPGGPKPANPFDQILSPFSEKNRTTGRDLNRGYGLSGKEDTMLNFIGGMGTEILTDPLTYLTFGASALTKGGKAAQSLGLMDKAPEVASRSLGRRVGKREARHIVTPRMLLSDPSIGRSDVRLALENRMRKEFGLSEADMDRQLGGLARINLPFSNKPFSFGGKPFTFGGLTDEYGVIGAGKIKGNGRPLPSPETEVPPPRGDDGDGWDSVPDDPSPSPPPTGGSSPPEINPSSGPVQPNTPPAGPASFGPIAPSPQVLPKDPIKDQPSVASGAKPKRDFSYTQDEIDAITNLGYEEEQDIPTEIKDVAKKLKTNPVRLLAVESAVDNIVNMIYKDGLPYLQVLDEIDSHVNFRLDELKLPNASPQEIDYAKNYASSINRPVVLDDLVQYGKQRLANAGKGKQQQEAERIFKKFGSFDMDENAYYRAVLGDAPKPKQQKSLIDEPTVEGKVPSVTPIVDVPSSAASTVPSVEPKPTGVLFKTERGSVYKVFEDGSTVRNKAKRPEHKGDFGIKERSARTIYVDQRGSNLSAAGSNAEDAQVVFHPDNTVSLVWKNPKTGKLAASKSTANVPYFNEPAVGLHPLEVWSKSDSKPDIPVESIESYKSMHLGNKITEIVMPAPTTAADDFTLTNKKAKSEKPVVVSGQAKELIDQASAKADDTVAPVVDKAKIDRINGWVRFLENAVEPNTQRPKYSPKEIDIARQVGYGDIEKALVEERQLKARNAAPRIGVMKFIQSAVTNKVLPETALDEAKQIARRFVVNDQLPNIKTDTAAKAEMIATREIFPELSQQDKALFTGPKDFGKQVGESYKDVLANASANKNINPRQKLESRVDLNTLDGLPDEAKPIVGSMISKIGTRLFDDVQVRVGGEGPRPDVLGDIDMDRGFIGIYNAAIKNKVVDRTTVHELWHHLSKYIPTDEVRAVRNEFEAARSKFKEASPGKELPYNLTSVDEYFSAKVTDLSMKYLGREKPVTLIGKTWAKALDVFEYIWDAIRQTLGYDQTKAIMQKFLSGKRSDAVKVSDKTMATRLADDLMPSNVLESSYGQQTKSPAFKNWFGDWEKDPKNASKVVDADGKPLVVYHGTRHSDLGVAARKERNRRTLELVSAEKEWLANSMPLRDELRKQRDVAREELNEAAKRLAEPLAPDKHSIGDIAHGLAYNSSRHDTLRDISKAWYPFARNQRSYTGPSGAILKKADDAFAAIEPFRQKLNDIENEISKIPRRPEHTLGELVEEEPFFDTLRYGENDEGYLSAGSYFTADTRVASNYAGPYEGSGVLPVYLNLKNPYIHGVTVDNQVDKLANQIYEKKAQTLRNARADVDDYSRARAESQREALIQLGYDGEIRDSKLAGKSRAFEDTEYVAFYPEQIKSATGNRGTFDPTSRNILESQTDPLLSSKEVADQLSEFRSAKIGKGLDTAAQTVLDSALGRSLTALFDQSVLGQLSKAGQEAARLAFTGYRESIYRERLYMSKFLRTWYETPNIREDEIITNELPSLDEYISRSGGNKKDAKLAQLVDARKIQNSRINDLRRLQERTLRNEDGAISQALIRITPDQLPAWVGQEMKGGRLVANPARRQEVADLLTSFRYKSLNMIVEENANGIPTQTIDGYSPRVLSVMPSNPLISWNPNFGKLIDVTHPHQRRRDDYLHGYDDGTSVINDISVDPEFSGVHSKKKVKQNPTESEIKQTARNLWLKYRDRLDARYSELTYDQLIQQDEVLAGKISDLTQKMMELNPDHAKYEIPLFSNDLFSAFELRLEHHYRSIAHAKVVQNLLGNSATTERLLPRDSEGTVLGNVLDKANYRGDTAIKKVLQKIPRSVMLEADKEFYDTKVFKRIKIIQDAFETALDPNPKNRKKLVDLNGGPVAWNPTESKAVFTNIIPTKNSNKQFDLEITFDTFDPSQSTARIVENVRDGDSWQSIYHDVQNPTNAVVDTYESTTPVDVMLQNLVVPQDVAEAVNKFVRGPKPLDEVKPLIQGYDKLTNLWKMMQTGMLPFLSFHTRNLGSGLASNLYLGTQMDPRFSEFNLANPMTWLNPLRSISEPVLDAHRIATGQTIPGISKAPIFAGKNLTDEQATEELRKIIYAKAIVGEKQGISAEQLMDTVGTAATQYPGVDGARSVNPLRGRFSQPVPESTFAQRWFMPWMSKGVLSDKDIFRPGQLGRDLGQYTESLNRLSPFISMIRRGYDPQAAAALVNKAQVDYTMLSNFEREYMRRMFPFYSYTRGVTPFVYGQLMERPAGAMGRQIIATTRAGQTDEQGVTPDYIRETASIPLGASEDGTRSYITGFGLPFEDPLQFAQLLRGNVSGTLRELGSRLNPVPKSVIETATGRSLYQAGPFGGREIEDLDPTIGRIRANINDLMTGEKTERAQPFLDSPWLEYAIANSGLGRSLNTVRTATDPRKYDTIPWKLLLNLGTGVRVADVSPSAQDAILRERLARVMKDFGGRMYTRPYFPDYAQENWTPEQAADAAQIEGLMKLLNQRATDRKKMEAAQ